MDHCKIFILPIIVLWNLQCKSIPKILPASEPVIFDQVNVKDSEQKIVMKLIALEIKSSKVL
jgi:hypothetical protein